MSQKLGDDFNLIDAWILDAELNETASIYMMPILQQKIDVAAALFALNYPFKQLVLTDLNTLSLPSSSIQQLLFWVIQPKDVTPEQFKQNLVQICRYVHIEISCCLEIMNTHVNVQVLKSSTVIQKTLEKDQVAPYLSAYFGKHFSIDNAQIEFICAEQQLVVNEPQTNFARLARQLKGKAILQALNLS